MKPSDYIIAFTLGLLGIIFHITAVKIPQTKSSAKVGNVPFSYVQFFTDEWTAILSTLVMLIIALCLIDTFLVYQPSAQPYIKAGFLFLGYTGSSFLVSLLGKAQGKINSVIDEKTNIADNK